MQQDNPSVIEESGEECSFIITEEDKNLFKRLDQFLSHSIPQCSRTFLKNLFLNNLITSPNQKLELKRMPPIGTNILVSLPPPTDLEAMPQDIPLEILFEDQHLIVINKQAGLVVHPAPGHPDGTLVNAILHHCPDLKGIGNKKRPGIVHRLDKGTTGVMVIAKDQKTHEELVIKFSKHDIKRKYIALTLNKNLPAGGTLTSTIGRHPSNRLKMATNAPKGKNATTHYRVLSNYKSLSLIECTLETGRTHQIRVHLSQLLNSPILGDTLYGQVNNQLKSLPNSFCELIGSYPHPFLHAKILGFTHPITNEELLFESPPPKMFLDLLNLAKEENHD